MPGSRQTKLALAALGIFGASLFFGDSMITPAISVLSAVEGLKVVEPSLEHLIIPITVIIVALFTGTITITTLLFFYIVRRQWGRPLWLVVLGGGGFLVVDLMFLTANLTKLIHGAWLPLLIGVLVFTVLTTWQRGRSVVTRRRQREEGSLADLIKELHERRPALLRVPGTAVFLNRGKATTPLAKRANVKHNHVLREHVVVQSIETDPAPYVAAGDRIAVDDLGYTDDGITHVRARFGYMEEPNVPDVLRLAIKARLECPPEVGDASYFCPPSR